MRVVIALGAFQLVLYIYTSVVDTLGGPSCDLYCGPGNLITAMAIDGLWVVIWIAALIAAIWSLVAANYRAVSLICLGGALVPVIWAIWAHIVGAGGS